MTTDHRAALSKIKRFDQLIAYLRDEMGWPIARDSFEDVNDLFYDFTAAELGIDAQNSAKILEIKRLRPLSAKQPWGIFFVKFEPKHLPVVALRRILSQVALKKRPSANSAERAAWAADDLLFISNYGEGDGRQISFAHFSRAPDGHDLPTLKVLGWDNLDTALHLDDVAKQLTEHLAWPDDDEDVEVWRKSWRAAFTLRHREVIATSKELSIRLAELARAIRDRIKAAIAIETEMGALTKLMKAFQEALVHDLDPDGFADMYAQTIAYGLLSARIADPHKKTTDDFAAHMRTSPFLRELMETFLKVGGRRGKAGGPGIDFDELGVSEVVDLLDDANMEAVVRDFGDRNPQEDPVIHFYELFLKEYDAKKRMQRGVFYTPRPVVSYIVRSVDDLLRTEFGLDDGLADTTSWGAMVERHPDLTLPDGVLPGQDFVQILDPATGTGTFLVEVINVIHKTLFDKWKAHGHSEDNIESLWNEYVPRHLLPRLHGYELLMAPYAIAHLKIGLKLYETGYRFGSTERARIFLTNALEAAQDFSDTLEFAIPALAHEATAVNQIKRTKRFTVVLGNPPYSYMSSNLELAQRQLVEPYKYVDGQRIRERGALQFELNLQDDYVKFLRLAEIICASTNVGLVGFVTNNSFLANVTFPGMRQHLLETFPKCSLLNLHGSLKAGTDLGKGIRDENVFDIQQGVSISLFVRSTSHRQREIRYGDLVGSRQSKYDHLIGARASNLTTEVMPRTPEYLFIPRDESLAAEYERGRALDEIFQLSSTGIMTNRDGLAIAETRSELLQRRDRFLDKRSTDSEIADEMGLSDNVVWSLTKARRSITKEEWTKSIVPVNYRPFDQQLIIYHPSVVSNLRRPVMSQLDGRKNLCLLTCRQQIVPGFQHVFVTRDIFECCLVSLKSREKTSGFPLWISDHDLLADGNRSANIKLADLEWFARAVPAWQSREDEQQISSIFNVVYAELHSPAYRSKYKDFLQRGFPRVFAPASKNLFDRLAHCGSELVALHLLESEKCKHPNTTFIGDRDSSVEKASWSDNCIWLDKAQSSGFRGVSEAVWNFHIGGYQVCEKWLKDRKGRILSQDDIMHYQKIIVVLAETIRLMNEIDKMIEDHGGWPAAFLDGNEST